MTPDFVFKHGSELAIAGWLALILAGNVRFVPTVLCKFVIPGLLAVAFASIVVTHWAGHQGGFESVQAVHTLFLDPWLLTAGWLHYLAFDLFVGAWRVRDAYRSAIPRWWTIPCLITTFLLGPIGLLIYLGLKGTISKEFTVPHGRPL